MIGSSKLKKATSDSKVSGFMSRFSKRIHKSPFLIQLLSWEYWPMHLIYVPVYAYYLLLSIKARSMFFFTAANPAIETGGLYGESKIDILNKIPDRFKPKTCFINNNPPIDDILVLLKTSEIDFPIVAKPNIGERGFLVEKLEDEQALVDYLEVHSKIEIILQEFVTFPEEVSVLYYRFPNEEKGAISSLTLKKFLTVTGNGQSTLRELIEDYPRALLQLEELEKRYADQMEDVLAVGIQMELIPIGNHCRGTTFLDGNHLIDDRLCATFDYISHQLPGIYFGRFDIKCQSLEDLKAGKKFAILEINGVKSEPTHIYDPDFSLREAYKILFEQWRTIYQISLANKQKGTPFMPMKDGLQKYWAWYRYKIN